MRLPFLFDSKKCVINLDLPDGAPFDVSILVRPHDAMGEVFAMAEKWAVVSPKQVHGVRVLRASDWGTVPARPEADGILLRENDGVVGTLRFADCFPVVIYDPDSRSLVMLHSGFLGTVRNIVKAGVESLEGDGGAFLCWVGPGIGKDCYCRDLDGDPCTLEAMESFDPAFFKKSGDKVFFDIAGQIRFQLVSLGVREESVFVSPLCTCCNNDVLYSYRGGDVEPRMLLVAKGRS